MDALINPVDWRRIGAVFSEAMELDPPRRAAFVEAASEGSSLIKTEVMTLLASDEATDGFLDEPVPLYELRAVSLSGASRGDMATRTLTRYGQRRRTSGMPVYSEGEMVAGRFRIGRMLGAGGMGEVYEAEDLLTSGTRIALKTIAANLDRDKRHRETFRAEVLAARAVTHPGVCRVYELHDDPMNDGMFLTMELLDGTNLSSVIRERTSVPFAESARLFLQIAEAVAAAHRAGILHCDIKLSNIILVTNEKGYRPVVTDFGLARVAERSTGHAGGGTPDYMAPELFTGAPPSFATDVYALGVLAVELLTGERLPHRTSALTGLPDLSSVRALPGRLQRGEWGRLVNRCLDNNPTRRFRSAAELTKAVDLLLDRTRRLTRRAALAAIVVTPLGAYYTYERLHPIGQTGVAILPFEDNSPGHNVQFLADSIPGELIRALSPVPGLRVTALTSTSRYRGESVSPIEIAQRLNVEYVVRGAVQVKDGGVVMNVEAVSGKTGRPVWKDEFRRGAGNNLALRKEVVLAVAGALPIALAPAQLLHLRGQPTSNAAAYDKFLLGMQLASTRTPDGMRSAIDLFTEASQMDPGFALAFAELSFVTNVTSGMHGSQADEMMRSSEAAAKRALQLDDSLPEAHWAMGILRQRRYFDWSGAESEYRAATRLNPGLAAAHQALAGLLSNLRRVPEALAEVKLARGLDPGSLPVNALYGAILTRGHQPDEAIHQLQLTCKLGPNYASGFALLGAAYSSKGNWKEAEAAYKRACELNPEDDFCAAGLAYVYARSGRLDDATAQLDRLIGRNASPVAIAWVYKGLNRFDDAIQSLETAWSQRDPNLSSVAAEIPNDELRQFPRYTALLKKMSLP